MRNPGLHPSHFERLPGVARALLLALLSTLFVIFPTNGLEPATAVTPANLNFNDGTCDLNAAGYLGSGSSADPYMVSDSDALWEVTDCSMTASAAAHFQITNDIDVSQAASASTTSPIGYSTSGDISFSGVIDGGNKIISGISMSASSYGVGLFAYLHNATISNLAIGGSFVTTTGGTAEKYSAGALAIRADGSLDLSSISNQASVTGNRHVGGLVGHVNSSANIDSSYNTGAVSGSNNVGGLVGYVKVNANINSSFNTGAVSGSLYVGGLVGYVDVDANINSSYNTGAVSGAYWIGGLVGWVDDGTANITSSYNTGTVSGSLYVGGLVGSVDDGTANITSSYNTGTVSGTTQVGGLVGRVFGGDANITSSYNTGAVSGTTQVGGLMGNVQNGNANITSSYNTGTVSGSNYVGGLMGSVVGKANINSSYNTGPVSGSDYVGGLVGYVDVDANITSSYNTGAVSGSNYVGGLAGYVNVDANINSSYNIGPVSGSRYVGGLMGSVGVNANINSSYNTGAVSGTSDVDGLAGQVSGTVTTASAYSSVTSDHVATSTVADMKLASTYVGFNFTSTWGFGSCTDNQGFPMLRIFAQISNYNSVACVDNSPPPQSTPSPGSTPAPVPVLQPLPVIDQTKIQTAAGTEQLLTGQRFELIRSATINGLPATISQLTATSLVLSIPALAAGNYSLDLETSNGRISFQGLVEIGEASMNPVQVGATFSVITGLNLRSSWLNRTALAELEEIFKGQSVVTCISYNDRPGVITRKKALSRAMHACRIADQLGIETRVFVYGKAPELADTVKILFR